MKDKIDLLDKTEQEKLDALVLEKAKTSNFSKLMPYINPKYLIFVGVLAASVSGFI